MVLATVGLLLFYHGPGGVSVDTGGPFCFGSQTFSHHQNRSKALAETTGAPPDYLSGERLVAVLSRDLRATVHNILDEIVRATLLQTLIHDWPAYLIHAIRVLADDHNHPDQFLQEMAVQMQAVVEEVCGAPQPAD